MLSGLISQRSRSWFERSDCPARPVVDYIRKRGFFRDAQIEAIKAYLFLKIEGRNRPLWRLLADGFLTGSEDLSSRHISRQAREVFESDPAARALYDLSRSREDSAAKGMLPELERYLLDHAGKVDCESIIKRLFYGVEYSDYLFSLPMGAGKTFLMAAFIFLDLYFAQTEPDNKIWAHNFILLVPSGLKSSILPSLRTIETFDATWVLPEPAASDVKRRIRFEMLDQPKSANKSNKTRSPNAVKVSSHQPFDDLMGLVMVTNAEKVVLDRLRFSEQGELIQQSDDEKDKYANELRNLIGKIPNLQILIDEVHHAATDDIKLRQVVNNWSKSGRISGVLGFSGTPYLASAETVHVADGVSLKFSQITNTVFYYPLTRAIETFLKKPTVRTITAVQPAAIVRHGVEEFLAQYGGRFYSGGQTAKLAIYCGTIERLEEEVYPLLLDMGIAPSDILKYHRGNKQHPAPAHAESEWKSLDSGQSKKRIVLLVQIGKEGWDCRSLAGVILSQKGDCPANMVLQTSCRCLRYMDGPAPNGAAETAGIWLNADNAKTLDKQLRDEQRTSIAEINSLAKSGGAVMRPRFSRVDRLRLPPVAFYQMRVTYDALTLQDAAPRETIEALDPAQFRGKAEIVTSGLNTSEEASRRFLEDERGEPADFQGWLLDISKGSFGAVPVRDLRALEDELHPIFDAVSFVDASGILRFNALYDSDALSSRIRLAFHARRTLETRREIVPKEARLLIVEKLAEIAADKKYLYPSEADCAQMLELDAAGKSPEEYVREQREKYQTALRLFEQQHLDTALLAPPVGSLSKPVENKDRAFHYAPYNFDSSFELDFLKQALTYDSLRERDLEVYFNGEGELTEFRIECFAHASQGWSRVGLYSPDFLVVERKAGQIHRVVIVETKGEGFAAGFASRRRFVEEEWLPMNNAEFGYRRFEFLYLDRDMNADTRYALDKKIKEFFTD
jgi:type III restriction enzyme